jgi:cellulose synthase (UDP-forming)
MVRLGAAVAIALFIRIGFPVSTRVTRILVVLVWFYLLGDYWLWRSRFSLNLSTLPNSSLSFGLWGCEGILLLASAIQMGLLPWATDRRAQADHAEVWLETQTPLPTVDILIPTYNEPSFIIKRTIVGCQALDYPHLQVSVLDDGDRAEIKTLTEELGCHYIARRDHRFAKAGNLNHGLTQTHGDLIACFDADFVPTQNFLRRTLGFFQDESIALVQTPQSFYNTDAIAYNLNLPAYLTPDEEIFYRHQQPIRDGVASVVCAGTSFVVRRPVLESVGGFVTDSICEDYFTGIKIAALGHGVIYLNEPLSAGLAAESIPDYIQQRLRWARGTLQAFFIDANPLTIPGLTLLQRLAHFEGLLSYFGSVARVGILLIPPILLILGAVPVNVTGNSALYHFLPFYGFHGLTYRWLNQRSRSVILCDLYNMLLTFPLAWTVIQTLINPFGQGFKVTPKGRQRNDSCYRWGFAWPLLGVAGLILISTIGWLVRGYPLRDGDGIFIAMGWMGYTLGIVVFCLWVLCDRPRPDPHPWVVWRRSVQVSHQGRVYEGQSIRASETGVVLLMQTQGQTMPGLNGAWVKLDWGYNSKRCLSGRIGDYTHIAAGVLQLEIHLDGLDLKGYRLWITELFCQPGQWKRANTLGSCQTIWLIFQSLTQKIAVLDKVMGAVPQPLALFRNCHSHPK